MRSVRGHGCTGGTNAHHAIPKRLKARVALGSRPLGVSGNRNEKWGPDIVSFVQPSIDLIFVLQGKVNNGCEIGIDKSPARHRLQPLNHRVGPAPVSGSGLNIADLDRKSTRL